MPRKTEPKWCYWVSETQNPELYGGYVPSLVRENEPGHSPMVGNPERIQAPWVWGKTLEEAQQVCDKMNAKMGIDKREALRIVGSSMFAHRLNKRRTKP